MPHLTIRKANSHDIEQLAKMFDAYRQFYKQVPDFTLAKRFIGDRLNKQDSIIYVVESFVDETQAQNLVGFCQLYPTFCSVIAAPICVLYDLFVDVSARKSGVGKALMLAAHEYAENNGYARLDLTTAKTNRNAQSLYESLSWVRDEMFFMYSKIL